VRSSLVLMIGRFDVVSRADLALEKSARWLIWTAIVHASAPWPTTPGEEYDLPGDEERGEVEHDVSERRGAANQVVLVADVGTALVVGVVLYSGRGTRRHGGRLHKRPPDITVPTDLSRSRPRAGWCIRAWGIRGGVIHVKPWPLVRMGRWTARDLRR